MADGSWDNGGYGKPAKAGLPLWSKIAMGCGIVAILALGTCVAGVAWGLNKAATLGKSQWPTYVQTVQALKASDSTKALYEANPRLKREFPDAAAFEREVADWRPALQAPPEAMPSITTGRVVSFVGKDSQFGKGESQASQNVAVTAYRMDDGRFLSIVWANGQIEEIKFSGKPAGHRQFDSR
jgi:hypothetical protein